MSKKIFSISISGRVTLNMHSLNNEGNEGNQVLTRQVTIIDQNGSPVTVTAVSGDMMKHITTEHFWRIALEGGIALSNTSKVFNANRIITDDLLKNNIKKKDLKEQSKVMDEVIKTCALSDIAGAMITDIGNFARKSIIEYGWLIALPESNETENYFHVKFVSDAKLIKEGQTEDTSGANEGQNIFHRPANSGIYAFVNHLEIARLGYNDISKKYPINDEERQKRYEALLKSILYTFIKPSGAMRNTQNPHVLNFEGIVSYSESSCPAPLISALQEGYREEIEKTAENLNKIVSDSITYKSFSSLSKFTEIIKDLIKQEPGKIINNSGD